MTLFTVGVGLIVIVALELRPAQVTPALVNDGIIPMVAFTGVDPTLVAAKGAIFPEPEAPNPMLVVEFVQAYEVPVPLMVIKLVLVPLQNVAFAIGVTTGIGFTVIVNVCTGPGQVTLLFKNCGVTETVAVAITEFDGFRALNATIFPVPLAASPTEVWLLVHV